MTKYEACKNSIKLNLPIQVDFFVHQHAELHMLQFYYDFLDKYLDRADFQMYKMNTDSVYIAIAGDSIESLEKPELHQEFRQDKCNWFPRMDTAKHRPMIREPQVCLRWNGRDKESWAYVPKPLTVLEPKTSSVVKALRKQTRLTKINILTYCSPNKKALASMAVFLCSVKLG